MKHLFTLTIILIALSSCSKEEYCYLSTFSSVQCEPRRVDIVTRRLNDTPMDTETCVEMRDHVRQELNDSGNTYYWKNHPVPVEELIYCKCY